MRQSKLFIAVRRFVLDSRRVLLLRQKGMGRGGNFLFGWLRGKLQQCRGCGSANVAGCGSNNPISNSNKRRALGVRRSSSPHEEAATTVAAVAPAVTAAVAAAD